MGTSPGDVPAPVPQVAEFRSCPDTESFVWGRCIAGIGLVWVLCDAISLALTCLRKLWITVKLLVNAPLHGSWYLNNHWLDRGEG